jgi:hypothetical protein
MFIAQNTMAWASYLSSGDLILFTKSPEAAKCLQSVEQSAQNTKVWPSYGSTQKWIFNFVHEEHRRNKMFANSQTISAKHTSYLSIQ